MEMHVIALLSQRVNVYLVTIIVDWFIPLKAQMIEKSNLFPQNKYLWHLLIDCDSQLKYT